MRNNKSHKDFSQRVDAFLKDYWQQTGKRPKYYLGKKFPGIQLSQREADCGILLLKELTPKQIADVLKLSERTVRFYIDAVKKKLRVRKNEHVTRLLAMSDMPKLYYAVRYSNVVIL